MLVKMLNSGERKGLTINHVSNCGTLEILGDGIDSASKTGHGVKGTSAVHDINVEEGNERKTELSTRAAQVPVQHIERLLDRVESNNLLEEIKHLIARVGVGEVGNVRVARPGGDSNKRNTGDDGTLDAVHEQDGCEHATAEDTNPHSGRAHLGRVRAETIDHLGGYTASELDGGVLCAGDGADSSTVAQADDSCGISIRSFNLTYEKYSLK